jgi:hypothetical protein
MREKEIKRKEKEERKLGQNKTENVYYSVRF